MDPLSLMRDSQTFATAMYAWDIATGSVNNEAQNKRILKNKASYMGSGYEQVRRKVLNGEYVSLANNESPYHRRQSWQNILGNHHFQKILRMSRLHIR